MPSPLTRQETETEAEPVVTEEELTQYFFNLDAPPAIPFPIDDQLHKIEDALVGKIPTDPVQVTELRSALFQLTKSAEMSDSKKNVCR